MKKLTTLAAIGAALTVFAAASPAYADGWDRQRVIIGPHGGEHHFKGRGYCDEHGCASQQRWTGPRGRTLTRKGSTDCYGGYCEGKAVWTGPRGNSAVVKRRFRRW